MRPVFEKVPGGPHMSWHCYVRRAERFPFGWHYHDEAELTLLLSGAGQRFVGDSIGRYEVGDFVLIGPNVPHSWRSERENGEQAAVVCQFRPDFPGAALLAAPEFAEVRRLLETAAAGVSFGPDAASEAQRVRNLRSLDGADRTLELMAVLQALTRREQSALSLNLQLNRLDAVSRKRIEAVISYIDRNYAGEATLQGAASVAAMTPSSLSRYFHAHTGRRFSDYVNDMRCAAASQYLVDSEKSVTSIAGACGFQNIANFNRRFRERFGMSPREYRTSFSSKHEHSNQIPVQPDKIGVKGP